MIYLIYLTLTFVGFAHYDLNAQTSVSTVLDITSTIEISGNRRYITGKLNCNLFGKTEKYKQLHFHPVRTTAQIDQNTQKSARLSATIRAHLTDHRIVYKAREIGLNIRQETPKKGLHKVTISLDDQFVTSTHHVIENDCKTDDFIFKTGTSTIDGIIAVYFDVPQGAHLIRVHRSAYNGTFQSAFHSTIRGGISPADFDVKSPYTEVFVKNNQQLSLDFRFNKFAYAESRNATFAISFEVIGVNHTLTSVDQFRQTMNRLLELTRTLRSQDTNSTRFATARSEFIDHAAGVLFQQGDAPSPIQKIYPKRVFELINALDSLHKENLDHTRQDVLVVKGIAGVLALTLSMHYLDSVIPYCRPISSEIDPFYDNEGHRPILAFEILHFIVNRIRLLLELDNYAFYDQVVQELRNLQDNGFTYGQFISDPKRADAMAKLFDTIQAEANQHFFVFKKSEMWLKKLGIHLKSMPIQIASTEMPFMEFIAQSKLKESEFATLFYKQFENFTPANETDIKSDDLENRLADLNTRKKRFKKALRETASYFDIDQSAQSTSFLSALQDEIMSRINVANKLLSFDKKKHHSRFLLALMHGYFSSNRSHRIHNEIQQCLLN